MIDLILKGIVTGFVLTVMIGPVFFVLLETSIKKGVRAGLALDFGVFLSDVIYVLIAFLFYNEVKNLVRVKVKKLPKQLVAWCFVYGIVTFLKTPSPIQVNESKEEKPANWREYIF
ncbi:MAG: LysE family transporter [Crocinitomicaceae bacterium]